MSKLVHISSLYLSNLAVSFSNTKYSLPSNKVTQIIYDHKIQVDDHDEYFHYISENVYENIIKQ